MLGWFLTLVSAACLLQDDPGADVSADGYMYGELAVARAIGSAAWKRDPSKRALIPTPDLVSIQLQPDDDFVLLATDGLWDKVDNIQVGFDLGLGLVQVA
jgi:serine/threonine protein phosphatase PrpC